MPSETPSSPPLFVIPAKVMVGWASAHQTPNAVGSPTRHLMPSEAVG
ncbi:hypothetical protein [Neisseria bergeri]|nr:hypothetical protein [Neisseria bergeri]